MAATTVDELKVLITAQSDQFQRELQQVKNHIAALERTSKGRFGGIGKSAVAAGNVIATALTKAFSAISSSMDDAVRRLDVLNGFPTVMSNLGIGTEEAQRAIDILSERLKGLPTTLDTAALAVQRFTSANGDIRASTELFLALNNAILAGNAPIDLQRSAMEQLSQAYTKGRIDIVEWRSAMAAMPAQLKQVATAMGLANPDILGEKLRNGEIAMNDFMNTIIRLNKEGLQGFPSFEEQARNSTSGVQTSIANLRTAIVRGLADIMNTIGQANIAAFFNGIAKAINAVVPYIIAFVKLTISGISLIARSIGSIFGRKTTSDAKDVSKSTEKTAGALSKAAAGASGVASGIDQAAGAAKKLQKQLASFDEMNVLQEPSAGGGGGGGNVGVGPLNIDDLIGGDDDDAGDKPNKVQQILDKIRNIFKKFTENPAIRGFTGVFRLIGEAIAWMWNKITAIKLPEGVRNFFSAIVGWFREITNNSVVRTILEGLAIAIGAVTAALTIGVAGWAAWKGAMAVGTTAVAAVTVSVRALAAALSFLAANPIVLVIAGITLLVSGLVLLVKNWDTVKDAAGKVWNWIGERTREFVKNVTDFFAELRDNIGRFFGNIGSWFGDRFTEAWNAIKKAFSLYIGFYKGLWDATVAIFTGAPRWFGDTFSAAWEAIKRAFSKTSEFFGGLWRSITGWFADAGTTFGNAIGNAFKTAVNAIIEFVERRINDVVDIMNKAIGLIDSITPGTLSRIGRVSLPRMMATGGLVFGPTNAIIGEAGRELVLPLDRNTEWMDELAARINGNGQPLHITVKLGEETILERIIEGINDQAFMRNENMLTI